MTTLTIDPARLEDGGDVRAAHSYDRLLDTAQAAAKLGVAKSTVTLLLREGRLRGKKHGRDWLIAEADLAGAEIHARGRRRPRGERRG